MEAGLSAQMPCREQLQRAFDKLNAYSSVAKVLYLALPQTFSEAFDDLDRDAMLPLLLRRQSRRRSAREHPRSTRRTVSVRRAM